MNKARGWQAVGALGSLVLAVAVVACSTPGPNQQPTPVPAAPARAKVTLAQPTEGFLWSPVYVARGQGLFEQEGLDVDVVITSGGTQAAAAVLGGSAQFGVTNMASVMQAADKGQDLVALTALMNQYASNVVISNAWAAKFGISADSPVDQKLAAFKGARIGITSPGSGTDQLARYLLRQSGLTPDTDAEIVPLGQSDAALAALRNNQVDIFCFSSPSSDTAISQGYGQLLLNLSAGELKQLDGYLYTVSLAKASYLRDNPAVAVRFVRALVRANELLKDNKEASKAAMKPYFEQFDPNVYDSAFDANYPAMAKDPLITPQQIEGVRAFMKETEGAPAQVAFEKVVNTDLVMQAQSTAQR
jgi:NitT/TauT family transport system substrate-binding protein